MHKYKIFLLPSKYLLQFFSSWILMTAITFPLIACADKVEKNQNLKKQPLENHNLSKIGSLVEERDFQSVAKLMKEKKLPLLVEFHADGCPYCKQLEDEFLSLMVGTPEYDNKIIIRQLKIDSSDHLIDFNGKEITTSEFAEHYNAFVTPTMVFLNAEGEQVAEKMVGINTPSLFGAYIDIEIEKALTKVRAKKPSQEGR